MFNGSGGSVSAGDLAQIVSGMPAELRGYYAYLHNSAIRIVRLLVGDDLLNKPDMTPQEKARFLSLNQLRNCVDAELLLKGYADTFDRASVSVWDLRSLNEKFAEWCASFSMTSGAAQLIFFLLADTAKQFADGTPDSVAYRLRTEYADRDGAALAEAFFDLEDLILRLSCPLRKVQENETAADRSDDSDEDEASGDSEAQRRAQAFWETVKALSPNPVTALRIGCAWLFPYQVTATLAKNSSLMQAAISNSPLEERRADELLRNSEPMYSLAAAVAQDPIYDENCEDMIPQEIEGKDQINGVLTYAEIVSKAFRKIYDAMPEEQRNYFVEKIVPNVELIALGLGLTQRQKDTLYKTKFGPDTEPWFIECHNVAFLRMSHYIAGMDKQLN